MNGFFRQRWIAPWVVLALALLPRFAAAQANSVWTPIGPNGAAVFALVADPFDATVLYAGTSFGGVYKTTDGGQSWSHLPSLAPKSSVFALAADPQTQGTFYASVFEAGIFKTRDEGRTWTPVNNGLSDRVIQTLAVDPNDANVVVAGSPTGLFRTADGGASWVQIPLLIGTKSILFDSVTAGVVYAASLESDGVYRSTDSGVTWTRFRAGLNGNLVVHLSTSPVSGAVFAVNGLGAVYRLDRGGSTWTFAGAGLPGTGQTLAHPTISGEVYAATVDGIYRSTDNGATWNVSLASTTMHPFTFAASHDGSVVYCGSLDAPGMVATVDHGASWANLNLGLQNLFVGGLATFPGPTGSVLYVASTGLYINYDGGPAWQVFEGFNKIVNDVQVSPLAGGLIYAGTLHDGVYLSSDFGGTWSQSSDGLVPPVINAFASTPARPARIFAATSAGFYVSIDAGRSWGTQFVVETVNIPDIFSIGISASDPDRVYFGGVNGAIYKTIDGASTEENTFLVAGIGLPAEDITSIAVTPDKVLVVTRDTGRVYASGDGGVHWIPSGAGIDGPALTVTADPTTPDTLYLGALGALYKSVDGGASWFLSNFGITSAGVISIVVDWNDGKTAYAGTLGGVFRTGDAGLTWVKVGKSLPGDPAISLAMSANDSNTVYASLLGRGIYRSTDGGTTWAAAGNGGLPASDARPVLANHALASVVYSSADLTGAYFSFDGGESWLASSHGMSLWVRRLVIHPTFPNVIYAVALRGGIFRSDDAGGTWRNLGLIDQYLLDLAVHPTNPNIAYATTNTGIYRILDGGASGWEFIGPDVFVMDVEVNPSDPNILYAAATNNEGMFKSVDGGTRWTPINNGLDVTDVFTLVIDPVEPDILYAGTSSGGVFVTTNGGGSWVPIRDGMFNQFVIWLAIDAADRKTIYAGTEGGGAFRTVRP